uniref:Uncharacterized protein n=1 Tax=Tetranychus urticae TaxID=32264 RepID=T1KG08_TETUR
MNPTQFTTGRQVNESNLNTNPSDRYIPRFNVNSL